VTRACKARKKQKQSNQAMQGGAPSLPFLERGDVGKAWEGFWLGGASACVVFGMGLEGGYWLGGRWGVIGLGCLKGEVKRGF
jgi:hypothetical protein